MDAFIWKEHRAPAHYAALFGLSMSVVPGSVSLITPFCAHGNIMTYLSRNPRAERLRLVGSITAGSLLDLTNTIIACTSC